MKFGLIGQKLTHSYSCEIHGFSGLDYSLFEVAPEKLGEFVKNCPLDGFNVTIPYKKEITQYLDVLSPTASVTGSVNVVFKKDGKLFGDNTDVLGLKYAFASKNYSPRGKKIAVLGSGGAAQAAIFYLKSEGAASVAVVSRKGRINYANCYDLLKGVQVVVNATPVGLFPDQESSPVDLSAFPELEFVYDFVYNPFETELLSQAKSLDIASCGGISTLVEQGLCAEDFWLGKTHAESQTESLVKKVVSHFGNVILFGMPSSGKTTVGKVVAERLGKEFFDTDDLVRAQFGKTPWEMITENGEEFFRSCESEVVKKVALFRNAVVALGGGTVLKAENVARLKKNGVFVRLDRDLSLLSVEGRPVSVKKGVKELFEERKPIYESVTDCVVSNDGTVEKCAEGVILSYENSCDKWC